MAVRTKTLTFPVDVRWIGGRLTQASVSGKPDLPVATPPEFKGGVEGVWSPEDLFVGAVAACYAVTLVAVSERRGVPLRALEVHGAGDVARRADGTFGFSAIELEVAVETDPGFEAEARLAGEAAEEGCLVSASLDTPVHLDLDIRTSSAAYELLSG
jgi:organic hydroperoxide reductase OsmC/OhrA